MFSFLLVSVENLEDIYAAKMTLKTGRKILAFSDVAFASKFLTFVTSMSGIRMVSFRCTTMTRLTWNQFHSSAWTNLDNDYQDLNVDEKRSRLYLLALQRILRLQNVLRSKFYLLFKINQWKISQIILQGRHEAGMKRQLKTILQNLIWTWQECKDIARK